MKVTIIQHVPFETPGLISRWITKRGFKSEIIKLFANQPLPKPADIEFLIVLGGPMSVNDSDQWIKDERQLINKVVTSNKPMLGICLGAQQLAVAFGSKVSSSPVEVGWAPVASTLTAKQLFNAPMSNDVLHWHGEGFNLPVQSVSLFTSNNWQNQGFQFLRAIGLQFHLETTDQSLPPLVNADTAFIKKSIFDTSPEIILSHQIERQNEELLDNILDYLVRITD